MFGALCLWLASPWSGDAGAAEVRVKGLPASVDLPADRWRWDTSQQDEIALWAPARGLPRFQIAHFETPQPDLELTDTDSVERFLTRDLSDSDNLSEVHAELHTIDGLGMTLLATGKERSGPVKLDFRMVVLPDRTGVLTLLGADIVGSPGLGRRMDELLAALHLDHPPLPRDRLPYGHVVLPAGYELDLPEHWRMLTTEEAPDDARELIDGGRHNRQIGQATFVDTKTLMSVDSELGTFVCRAMYAPGEPLQPLEPRRDPVSAGNLLARLTVLIGGGTLQRGDTWVGEVLSWHVRGDSGVVDLGETDPQTVTIETLTDRPAFHWQGPGTRMGSEVTVDAWLTSWDDVELYCVSVVPTGSDGTLKDFDQAMRSLHVTDAAEHPMYVSLRTRYINWWPWSHPLLQLYALPAYFILPLFAVLLWWSRGSSKPISIRG